MKAKLITNAGFTKIIEIKEITNYIEVPFATKIQLASPELYGIAVNIGCTAKFQLEKKLKKYAIFKQIDAVVDITKRN